MLQLMLSSGILINISVNIFTGDVLKIVFDKYLMGKLLSEYVTDGKHWTQVRDLLYTQQYRDNWFFVFLYTWCINFIHTFLCHFFIFEMYGVFRVTTVSKY